MVPELNILHNVTESLGAVDVAALGFIIKESTGDHPTQHNYPKKMTLLFDSERYDELIERLKNHNAILGGFETISELQQLLEEIEGESAWDSYVASFYSY